MDAQYVESRAEFVSATEVDPPPQEPQTGSSMQDYFSARPIPTSSRPEHDFVVQYAGRFRHARNTSTDSVTSNPSFLHPCPSNLSTSPSQRAISSSSWTQYSPSGPPTPFGQLKASWLCKSSGTTPTYDPPVSEWTFLGADQPAYSGKPYVRPEYHLRHRHKSSSSRSWTSLAGEEADVVTFAKHPVKRACTSSHLTASLKGSSLGCVEEENMLRLRKLGLEGMSLELLPSAFDDSEDEA